MRSISLVDKLEVDYKGTLFQNAICLVDIDNDGFNELCVGFTNGELHVYKGIENGKPWKMNKDLGSLNVLCGGCVLNNTEKLLCTLDSEGRCRLFDVFIENSGNMSQPESFVNSFVTSPNNKELRLIHQEQLHANAKVAILEDIDDDGVDELIVGFTDRYVRIYKWKIEESEHMDSTLLTQLADSLNSTNNVTIKHSIDVDRKSMLSFSLSLSKETKQQQQQHHHREMSSTPSVKTNIGDHPSTDICDHTDGKRPGSPSCPVGRFVLIKQFSVLAQIGSLAVCKTALGLNELIVSQPNGGYSILGQYDHDTGFTDAVSTPTCTEPSTIVIPDSYPTFYPIRSSNFRSSNHVNTEVIGGIKRQNRLTGVIGLCTHSGNFIMLDNTYILSENPIKNRSQNHWFAMSKLDVTNDGDDEIVLCSMEGMTYIIDKQRDIVSFNFNNNVAAFCAGYYGVHGKSCPCFCYVTLSGKIHLYYDVWIDAMKVKCVHTALIGKIKERPEYHYLMDLFKTQTGEVDHERLQNLIKNIHRLKNK